MHIEQIDRYCDLFEHRLRQGDALPVEQFLREQQLPQDAELLAELHRLEREYRAQPPGIQPSRVLNNRAVPSLSIHRSSRVLVADYAMPAASIHDLESAILRAGILSHDEWNAALSSLPPDTREAGPETVVQELARGGRITDFQKQMLLAGQADGLVLGEYTLLSLLGAGGMGRVFRALHRRMGREVALKVLPERVVAQDEAIQRFEREVRVAARLVHHNVVTAYDAGESQGTHYLVMEYVPGADLATVVKSLGPLPVADSLCCAIQAAAGLAYAHSQGITHRDIKPGNLLLNPQGAVKVLDLGLARMRAELPGQSDSLSASGTVMGTVDFMPPEQALNSRLADERSDVYSLGCTLYFLLTGRPVFRGETVMEKLLAHREAPLPDLRADCPGAPPQLNAVLARMLAKAPSDRYASMGDVESALRECLAATGESADLRVQTASRLGDLSNKPAAAESTRNYLIERSMLSTHVAHAPTYVPSPSAAPQPAPADTPGRRGRRRWPVLVGGLALLLALGAAIVLTLQSADGTLVIDVIEPGAQILVDDKQVATVTSADGNHVYRISVDPGRRVVKVRTQDGVEFFSEDVTISAGQPTPLLTARIEKGRPPPPPATNPVEDDILTVAQDGSAEFTSLQSALDAVQKPGTTIRVVDDAEYAEPLHLQLPARHSRLTLDSMNRATLVSPVGGAAVTVMGVDHVTIRGFRVRVAQMPSYGVGMLGNCPGCVLDDIEFNGSAGGWQGVALEGLSIPNNADPVIVQGCRFESLYMGVRISGIEGDYKTPMSCRGVLIADNTFANGTAAVSIIGAVRDVAVVGNRAIKCAMAGVQFEQLIDDMGGNAPRGLLVANNTFLDCAASLKLWDDQVRESAVSVLANLVLSPAGVDWQYVDSGDHPANPKGPGDGKQVLEHWRIGRNWRETAVPQGTTIYERAWIPRAESDVLQSPIEVRSRNPQDADFLQPLDGSPLATGGAGESEGLPVWVGAVPPPDTQNWDWRKSWEKLTGIDPAEDNVLTVAQDGSAELDSLKAALDAVRPGMTIRILDDAEYTGPFMLQAPSRQQGITLEAAARATLVAPRGNDALAILQVRGVTLRGFRVRATEEQSIAVEITGNCAGTVLEDLDIRGAMNQNRGILMTGLTVPPQADPVIVRRCRFEALNLAVGLNGLAGADLASPNPCRGALVVDNLFLENMDGLTLVGAVRDIVIAANRFVSCGNTGIQLGRLRDDARGVPPGRMLLANNSFLDCAGSLVLWDDDVRGQDVAVRNNLVLSPVTVDWTFLQSDDLTVPKAAGDGKRVLERWTFGGNWRETAPPQGTSLREQAWIPKAEHDVLHEPITVASRHAGDADFLQPAADSPLATGGSGADAGLPAYVGAVPPAGAPAWDWNTTWESWLKYE